MAMDPPSVSWHVRPATLEDVPLLTAVARAEDVAWWGEPDTDEDEVEHDLAAMHDLHGSTLVVETDDGTILGWTARLRREEGTLHLRPTLDATTAPEVEDALLSWLTAVGVRDLDAPDHDGRRLAALARHGFEPAHLRVELVRPPHPSDAGPPPDGFELHPIDPGRDAGALHTLIYQRAGWARVPGHRDRPADEWRRLFLDYPGFDADLQVALGQEDALAGVALCRVYGGTHGWVMQLAVAEAHRGQGLGRWLLAEAAGRLSRVEGIEEIGLSVLSENRGALSLYESVGFESDRRWVLHRRSAEGQQTLRRSE